MPFLSWKKGRPIAKVRGGRNDGKILRLYDETKKDLYEKKKKNKKPKDDEDDSDFEMDDLDYVENKLFTKLDSHRNVRRLSFKKMSELEKAIKNRKEPEDEELSDYYKKAINIINQRHKKEIILNDGELVPIPNTELDKTTEKDKADAIFIAGPRDSGKSTWASNFISQYLDFYPKNKFYIFSRVENDNVLDHLKPRRIMICDELLDDPMKCSDFPDSMVLFDDIDTRSDKSNELSQTIRSLRDEIFENGRHSSTSVIACAHMLTNYKETRNLLSEADGVVIFPKAGYLNQVHRFLKTYVGIDKKPDVDKLLNVPSRWCLIYKRYPMFVMYSTGCYLI